MTFASTFRNEIIRLTRRELRPHVDPLRKQASDYRRQIVALKRSVAALEKIVARLQRGAAKASSGSPPEGEGTRITRFSAKGLRTLRTRLGFSAAQMGKLLGVSGQSVYNWEGQKSVPRKSQLVALAQLRGVGKRKAQARLDAAATPKKKRKARHDG